MTPPFKSVKIEMFQTRTKRNHKGNICIMGGRPGVPGGIWEVPRRCPGGPRGGQRVPRCPGRAGSPRSSWGVPVSGCCFFYIDTRKLFVSYLTTLL
jgi:hypothetical protein